MKLNIDKVQEILSMNEPTMVYTTAYLASLQGISHRTFYRRTKNGTWTLEGLIALGVTLGRLHKRRPISPKELILNE